MPIYTLQELAAHRHLKQRLLGFDVGDKTIGISISDINWQIASPLEVVKRTHLSADLKALKEIILVHNIGGIIIGLPISMSGRDSEQTQKVRKFVDQLAAAFDLPLCLWDERLSTMAVTRTLLDADLSRKKRSKVVDKLAATYILQGALDSLSLASS
jgi:putative Holliday junction resolvase